MFADNGTVVFVVTDDLAGEVAVFHTGAVTALYLADDAAYLTSTLDGGVAVAIPDVVTVIFHIAADGTYFIAVMDIRRLNRAVDHRTMGDGAMVLHPAAEGAHMLVAAVASLDGNILQPEIFYPAVVNPAKECAVVLLATDIDILDSVTLSVEVAAEAMPVVPADGQGLDVLVVQVNVIHQVDGPA